jgi:hypothetical protein
MFEDILDGFKDLEDELEKKPDPGFGEEDPGNILSLDSDTGEWDTGESDTWTTGGESEPDDKIWGV